MVFNLIKVGLSLPKNIQAAHYAVAGITGAATIIASYINFQKSKMEHETAKVNRETAEMNAQANKTCRRKEGSSNDKWSSDENPIKTKTVKTEAEKKENKKKQDKDKS